MKKNIGLLTLLFCMLFSMSSYAQLSKEEHKEWKNKAKEYKKNPEELKALVDEYQSLKSQTASLSSQVESLQGQLNDKDSKLASLKSQVDELQSKLSSAQSQMADMKKNMSAKPEKLDESGIWFKVQVGAFKNIDMSEYFKNNPNFSGETTEDGLQRITLGRFRDYWEANKFKKVLREMGVKEAWIVPYQDGNRISMKDALENVSMKKDDAGK